MLGFNSLTAAVARSTIGAVSNASSASSSRTTGLFRALSTTTESLKVKSTTPPPVASQEERIKYFKIYRWDPDHRQKPVSWFDFIVIFDLNDDVFLNNILTVFLINNDYYISNSTSQPTP